MRFNTDLPSTNSDASVSDVLEIATQSGLYADERTILLELLPERSTFDDELEDLSDNPSSLLSEVDPLVLPDQRDPTSVSLLSYDREGLSGYARIGAALIRVLSQSRNLAKEYLWTFRHLLMLQQLGSDFVAVPFWPSDAFERGSIDEVKSTLDSVTQIVIYLGNSLLGELSHDWHRTLIERLRQPATTSNPPQNAQDIIYEAYSLASHSSARLRDVRLLRRVMQMVLRDVGSDTLDLWAGFAHAIQNDRKPFIPDGHSSISNMVSTPPRSQSISSDRICCCCERRRERTARSLEE